jgi:hypothetical protein
MVGVNPRRSMTADRVKNPFETVLGWIWYLTGSIEPLAVFGILKSVWQKAVKRQNTIQI